MTKICTKCKIEKDFEEFSNDKYNKKYGKRLHCKQCCASYNKENKEYLSKYHREYRIKNIEFLLNQGKEYRKKNKEYSLNYRKKNKEHIANLNKNYRKKNKESIAIRDKIYRKENRKYFSNYQNNYRKNRRKTDPIFKMQLNIHSAFFNYMNGKKAMKFFDYVDYTSQDLDNYFKDKLFDGVHVDHIIPKKLYDYTNPEHIKKCWSLQNLRCITAEENLKKSDKLDMELVKQHNIEHLLP